MLSKRPRFVLVAAIAVSLLVGGAVGGAIAAQPHMTAARSFLNSALTELQAALPNKAGHRERAIDLVQRAIAQVNDGIAAGS